VDYHLPELFLLTFKSVVDLEDANIHAVIVVVERAKLALVDANALVNAPEDASVLPVLAVQVKDFAVLKDAAAAVVGARFLNHLI
jgi:hypothetical protein